MYYPYEERSPLHRLKIDGKVYRWYRTVKGKSEAIKIRDDIKRTGNLARIIPTTIKGRYKIYIYGI